MQQMTSEVTVLREKVCQSEVDHKRAIALVEKKLQTVTEEAATLRAEVERFRALEKGHGSTLKMVVTKLMHTSDFGNWCMKLTKGAVSWGKNLVLRQLMKACPQMLLKEKQLGWDPYCKSRTDNWQQSVFKEIPEFTLLTELAQSQHFWLADEVEKLETDYDKDFDVVYPEVPAEWECEDDAAPFFRIDPFL